MAETLAGPAHDSADTAPEFPMPRAARCPFDPPPGLKELQEQGPLAKVRLWDGSEPWLVTRYAEQRAVLGDPGSAPTPISRVIRPRPVPRPARASSASS